jgi:hypothetical protein
MIGKGKIIILTVGIIAIAIIIIVAMSLGYNTTILTGAVAGITGLLTSVLFYYRGKAVSKKELNLDYELLARMIIEQNAKLRTPPPGIKNSQE